MTAHRRLFPSLSVPISCLLLLAIALGACSTKTVRYPEDHERLLRIDQAVESLRDTYQQKNRSGFQSLLVSTDQLEELQRQAFIDFETFHAISLEFTIERVIIAKEDIDVFVHWQGRWKKDAADQGLWQRGHMRLQWVGTQTILLRAAQGDLPFGMKTKQLLPQAVSPPTPPR
jgi:hypothetical protein